MFNILYRLFLCFNATCLLIIIFAVKNQQTIGDFSIWTKNLPDFLSYIIYILIPILFTNWSIKLGPHLGKDEFPKGNVKSIELHNHSFLPSYLGYFFVALSINSWETLLFIYLAVFIFILFSQQMYFNPFLLLFGYNFFKIETQNGTRILLISKKAYKRPNEVIIPTVFRINDFTFFEIES